jgi:hypothetical protein
MTTVSETYEEAFEMAASAIHGQWSGKQGYVPWVNGGNGWMQAEARRHANMAIHVFLGTMSIGGFELVPVKK